MKRLILMLCFITTIIGVENVNAQGTVNGTGGMSDYKVTLPVITPQITPSVGLNAVNIVSTPVPSIPALTTLTIPAVSPIPSLSAPNLLPSIPATPTPPVAPANGTLPAAGTFTTTLSLPVVPMLPPIPSIPPTPGIRLPIGSQ